MISSCSASSGLQYARHVSALGVPGSDIKILTDLEKDLKSISVKKAMLLFVSLNITFIALIFAITSFFK